ncbi:MAG: hypothetical protein K8T10_04845 [Candidatus Eremiobacteraeota bacterium]|nr:hypothetical protein [Candidatus Eremiobacteraeota bacterium]
MSHKKILFPILILVVIVALLCVGVFIYKKNFQSSESAENSISVTVGTSTKAKITPLTSKTMEPSDEEQTLSWKDQVKVTFPGGAFKNKQKVTISSVEGAPAIGIKCLKGLGAYDISAGDRREFDKPIIIELAYDPAKIKGDYPPEESLLAAYWDERQKTWQIVPTVVDTKRNVVLIGTKHLSLWESCCLLAGWRIEETEHFKIAYDPDSKKEVEVGILSARYKGKSITKYRSHEDFANLVGGLLEHAYKKYTNKKNGFKPPWMINWTEVPFALFSAPGTCTKIWVFIDVNPNLDASWGEKLDASQREKLVGTIHLFHEYASQDALRQESAHELFHSVQNEYMNFVSMASRIWFMDATADYAGEKVAWDHIKEMKVMGEGINFKYIEKPITDKGQRYRTSHFIDYLVKKGSADFKEMFEEVMKGGSPTNKMNGYLKKKTGKSLGYHYRGFAGWLLFDPSGPIPAAKTGRDLLYQGTFRNDPMLLNKKEVEWKVELKEQYTGKLWGIMAEIDPKKKERTLKIEMLEKSGDGLYADVYMLKKNKRAIGTKTVSFPYDILLKEGDEFNVELEDGDALYVLAVNTSVNNRSARIKVSEVGSCWKLVETKHDGMRDPNTNAETWKGTSQSGCLRENYTRDWYHMVDNSKVAEIQFSDYVKWTPPPKEPKLGDKWDGKYEGAFTEFRFRRLEEGSDNIPLYQIRIETYGHFVSSPSTYKKINIGHLWPNWSETGRSKTAEQIIFDVRSDKSPRIKPKSTILFPDNIDSSNRSHKFCVIVVKAKLGASEDTYYYIYEWVPK